MSPVISQDHVYACQLTCQLINKIGIEMIRTYIVLIALCLITSHLNAFTMHSKVTRQSFMKINMNKNLNSLSTSLFDKIQSTLLLKETDYTSSTGLQATIVKDVKGKDYSVASKWFDEQKGTKMTGQ